MGAGPYLGAVCGVLLLAVVVSRHWRIAGWSTGQAWLGLLFAGALAPAWLILWEAVFTRVAAPGWIVWLEWHLPLAGFAFAWLCAARLAPAGWLRRPLLLVGAGLLLWPAAVFVGPALLAGGALSLSRDDTIPWQTTWWSCGAAAAANLVGDWSEHEAAVACGTRPGLGTLPSGLVAGLRQHGLRPMVHWFADPEILLFQDRPCLVYVRIYGRVIHVAEVTAADSGGVRMLDPCRGPLRLSWDEFAAEWLGLVVTLDEGQDYAATGRTEPRVAPAALTGRMSRGRLDDPLPRPAA